MAVTFVNGETFIRPYGLTGDGEYTPVFMKKDGKQFFIRNSVRPLRHDSWTEYEHKRSIDETEMAKAHLLETDGKWFCFYGIKKNPFEFIKWVQEHNYSFRVFGRLFEEHKDFTDFHGNLVEYSAAFSFHIYDKTVINELKSIVNGIRQVPV